MIYPNWTIWILINIHGIQGTQTALHDNGSEINLINREFVEQLPNLPSMGRIKIKGPAVETALSILDMNPAAMDANTINIAPPLREVFAVCEGLNENIILTADTVNRLVALINYASFVARTVVENEVETSNIDGEIIDQNEEKEYDEIKNIETSHLEITYRYAFFLA